MNVPRIDQESEDLFASDCEDESLKDGERENEEEDNDDDDDGSKLSAAAALTSLVQAASLKTTSERAAALATHDEDDEGDEDAEDGKDFEIPQRFTKSGRKRAVPFPIKLLKVLSNKRFNDVIAWTPSGKAFNIVKPKQFVADILPTHFKSAKYSSFTRKLHRWGFMRHYRGEEAGAYYHELFLRDRMDMVEQMTCHKQEPLIKAKVVAHQHKAAAAPAVAVRKPAPIVASAPTPALATRQCLAAATANLSLHSRNMASMPPAAITGSLTDVEARRVDLNAAIELEVARRLKERLESAAFSRQAHFALMEQQQQQQQQQFRLQQQLQAQQQQALENVRMLLSQTSTPQPQLNHLQSPRVMELAQLYNKIKAQPQQQYMAFGNTPMSLPETNIQGAKTA